MSATASTKDELPSNSVSSAKQAKRGKKRKHVKQSPEEQYQIESTDKYNKLRHACSKHLHREAKVVKSFECQKIVRAIKTANESLSSQAQEDNKNKDVGEKKETKNSKLSKRVQTLQQKLDRTKQMDLDVLVQVGLKRLGVLSLGPRNDEEVTHDNDNGKVVSIERDEGTTESAPTENPENSDAKTSSQNKDPFYQTLLESMLRHKRLSNGLDQLNEKVTEYRQWKMHREAMMRGDDNPEDRTKGGKRKKKKNQHAKAFTGNDTMVVAGGFNSRKRGPDLGGHEGASGLFIGSLSGMQAEGYANEGQGYNEGEYGDGGEYGYQEEKKKNRPGQRARKAKAMAIEARKAGKTWDSSTNWREKKSERDDNNYAEAPKGEGRDGRHGDKSRGKEGRRSEKGGVEKTKKAQHIATMGKTWKEDGNAHPSWAAAAAQKAQGIAKFKGTKITFD